MRKTVFISFLIIALILIFNAQVKSQKNTVALNHIAIYINDLTTSIAFYRNIILLDTIPNPFNDGRHVFFKIGRHSQLHLVKCAIKVSKDFTLKHM